jgi:hypothetical protein
VTQKIEGLIDIVSQRMGCVVLSPDTGLLSRVLVVASGRFAHRQRLSETDGVVGSRDPVGNAKVSSGNTFELFRVDFSDSGGIQRDLARECARSSRCARKDRMRTWIFLCCAVVGVGLPAAFSAATDYMIGNFDAALSRFEADMRAGKAITGFQRAFQ